MSHPYPGTFVSFEGLDGAGKSTQIDRFAADALKAGREVLIVREPGGTSLGELQRAIVKADIDSLVATLISCGADGEALTKALGTTDEPLIALPEDITARTQMFMFNASRSQLFETKIRPALERGALVVADRYADSTVAYQSGSGGLDPDEVMANCLQATGGVVPDLTIYCRLDAHTRAERMRARGLTEDVIERTSNFQAIAATFDRLAKDNPDRFVVVDAGQSIDDVAAQIRVHMAPLLAAGPEPSPSDDIEPNPDSHSMSL